MHPDDQIKHFHVGWYRAPANQTEVNATIIRPNCEYIELVTGCGVFHDDGAGEKYYGEGALFWHFPGEKTINKFIHGKPYECLVVMFKILPRCERIAPRVTFCTTMDPRKFADETLSAFHDDSFDRRILARSVHAQLLREAYLYSRSESRRNIPMQLENALQIIETSFLSDLSVENLASQASISVPHLHMLFKKYLNESPHQRIISRRLLEAKNILASTDSSLKSLSFDCGFQNPEHFCRLFKQRFSMTPSEFRRRSSPYNRDSDKK